MKRYCGSKNPHPPHWWRQLGKKYGPRFDCPGKIDPITGGPYQWTETDV